MTMQRGCIVRKGRGWYLRYYDTVLDSNGKPFRKKLCRKLAEYCDRYRSEKSVRSLADEILNPLNAGRVRPESTMLVSGFIENEYLPYVQRSKRPSTVKGYRDIWNVHIKARIGEISLREFRPADGTRLLQDIAIHAAEPLGRRSMYHIKSFLSGVFAHAISQGWLDCHNPMHDAKIPSGLKPAQDTSAYDLHTIERILALPELVDTARLAIAIAAYTGLRKGEIAGLRWEDFTGTELTVSRSVWHQRITDPKTERSKAPVEIIPRLSSMLQAHRNGRTSGYVFASRSGQPLDLDNLARRSIVPVLAVNQIKWLGWHAFRRGLATNLHRLGINDKTIQNILRHSSLATTQAIYIKVVGDDVRSAMQRLEAALPSTPKRLN